MPWKYNIEEFRELANKAKTFEGAEQGSMLFKAINYFKDIREYGSDKEVDSITKADALLAYDLLEIMTQDFVVCLSNVKRMLNEVIQDD